MARIPASEDSSLGLSVASAGQSALGRLSSFRPVYLAVALFVLLYVSTVAGLETWLAARYERQVQRAVRVTALDVPVGEQIQRQMRARVDDSPWVRWGGVRVNAHVFGSDGRLLFLNGRSTAPPTDGLDPAAIMREAERLLPASAMLDDVSIPIDSVLSSAILVVYAAALLQGLFVYNRRIARRQSAILEGAQSEREAAAQRAESIQSELEAVRGRLSEVEPAEREHADAIQAMRKERAALLGQLEQLAAREEELRAGAARAIELDQERQALEDLLDEAMGDLDTKNTEIEELERNLKKASRGKGAGGGRSRESESLARRLRTLYKTVEVDDRAVDDLIALRDEGMKLKAEEAIKRLADEADNVAVRRKVGGLPPYLSIFELGFAGKGRIYYTKGRQRRFRVLLVGAKNTQKPDLEYLSRLDRSEMA